MLRMQRTQLLLILLCLFALIASGCEATAQMVIPTAIPTITPTYTPSPTRTPARNASPTPRGNVEPTEGPSPTALFEAVNTAVPLNVTPTRVFNPNAPRIEFFTSDVLSVEP